MSPKNCNRYTESKNNYLFLLAISIFSKKRTPISIYQENFPDMLAFNHLIINFLSCQGIPHLYTFNIFNFREQNIRFYSKHKRSITFSISSHFPLKNEF